MSEEELEQLRADAQRSEAIVALFQAALDIPFGIMARLEIVGTQLGIESEDEDHFSLEVLTPETVGLVQSAMVIIAGHAIAKLKETEELWNHMIEAHPEEAFKLLDEVIEKGNQ